MGRGIRLRCPACRWNRNFKVGVGMRYLDYDVLLPGRLAPVLCLKVQQIMQRDDYRACECHEGIFRCPECARLYGRFYCQVHYGDTAYEVPHACKHCESPLQHVPMEEESTLACPCPKCGRTGLAIEIEMLWD